MAAAEVASDPHSRAARPWVARAVARCVTAAFDSAATSRSTAWAKPGRLPEALSDGDGSPTGGSDAAGPGSVGSAVRRAAACARC